MEFPPPNSLQRGALQIMLDLSDYVSEPSDLSGYVSELPNSTLETTRPLSASTVWGETDSAGCYIIIVLSSSAKLRRLETQVHSKGKVPQTSSFTSFPLAGREARFPSPRERAPSVSSCHLGLISGFHPVPRAAASIPIGQASAPRCSGRPFQLHVILV